MLVDVSVGAVQAGEGAVKLPVGLDHGGYLPIFVRITDGKTSDIEAARALELPRGSIVVADRA